MEALGPAVPVSLWHTQANGTPIAPSLPDSRTTPVPRQRSSAVVMSPPSPSMRLSGQGSVVFSTGPHAPLNYMSAGAPGASTSGQTVWVRPSTSPTPTGHFPSMRTAGVTSPSKTAPTAAAAGLAAAHPVNTRGVSAATPVVTAVAASATTTPIEAWAWGSPRGNSTSAAIHIPRTPRSSAVRAALPVTACPPPMPGTSSRGCINRDTVDAEDGETMDGLRAEVGGLRSELEALRSMLGDGAQPDDMQLLKLQSEQKPENSQQRQQAAVEAHSRCAQPEAESQPALPVGGGGFSTALCCGVERAAQDIGEAFASLERRVADEFARRGDDGGASGPRSRTQSAQGSPVGTPTASWEPPALASAASCPTTLATNQSQRSMQGLGQATPGSAGGTPASEFLAMSRQGNGASSPRLGAQRTDVIDELWCSALQRFPQYPHWTLLKEKRGIYRMGNPYGKKILCQVSHAGLQVRVGGGWMAAVPFLEKYGPTGMGTRPSEEKVSKVTTERRACESMGSIIDTPASMERLLVPTKAWAQKIGINKNPDLREQRRRIASQDTAAPARRTGGGSITTAPAALASDVAAAAASVGSAAAAAALRAHHARPAHTGKQPPSARSQ